MHTVTTTPEFFRDEEIVEIKNWLQQRGAGLFRRALEQEIVATQIDASNDMVKAAEPDRERFKGDAEKKIRRVHDLRKVLAELDRVASVDFKPFVARVTTSSK